MQLEMILNELYLKNTVDDERVARELMTKFIKTITLAVNKGIVTLRTENRIYDLIIAPNYPISKWLNDNQVDLEQRDFLLTLETQTPLLKEITDEVIKNKIDLSDFKYQGEIARELGICYLFDNLAISFNCNQKWNSDQLELELATIDENDELIESKIKVNHASCEIHIEKHTTWIQTRIYSTINNGKELWSRKQELFPNLEFCDSVQKQLEDILSEQLELQPVRKTLLILQNHCQAWKSGDFYIESSILEYSPESNQTLNNSKYKKQREFICPDGQKRLFSLHAKLRICNWRIYFYPDQADKKVIIGYIGKHLSTDKYPT
jgi:hypothetical protein